MAAKIAGIPVINPYFIKSKKEYFTPSLFTILLHIIPARAPAGVKKAPILDPAIEANAAIFAESPASLDIELNKTLMGILFIKLATSIEEVPYTREASPR